jgi:hypothetical protein
MAKAMSDKPMTFETFIPCSGNASFCGMRVLAKGKIEIDSAKQLQAFLRTQATKDKYFNPNPTIVFDSLGGSLLGGIELGKLIRRLKLDTELAPIYTEEVLDRSPSGYHERIVAKDVICASACSLAFIGGVRRTLTKGGKLGVHQFSTISGTLSEGDSQVTVTTLASYVSEMGVDRQMIDLASMTASTSIYLITPQVARQLRIDNTVAPLASWKINVDSNGTPRLEVLQEVAPGHMVMLTFGEVGGRYVLSVISAFSLQQFQPNRLNQFPVSMQGNVQFIVDRRQKIHPQALDAWVFESTQKNGWATFRANFQLNRSQMDIFRRATTLQIDDEFSHATIDISLATELSVENLTGGMGLLLRNGK